MRKFVMILLVAILVAATTILSFGSSIMQDEGYIMINKGEIVKGDFITGGIEVNNMGKVTGDLIAGATNFYNTGEVGGDIIVGANYASIGGEVDGDLRIGAQSVEVTGIIHKNVTAFVQSLTVNGEVKGSVTAFGNSVVINGAVGGDYRGAMATTTINGLVEGNVDLEADRINFGPNAVVEGNLTYTSHQEMTIPEGVVKGTVERLVPVEADIEIDTEQWEYGIRRFKIIWNVVFGIGYLVVGAVAYLLFSRFLIKSGGQIKNRPGASFGIGLLAMIVTPIAAGLFMITVIGMPLSWIALIVYGLVTYLARLPVAQFIGRSMSKEENGSFFSFMLALVIVTVLVKIPYAGFFFTLLTVIFGLGGYFLTAQSYYKKPVELPTEE